MIGTLFFDLGGYTYKLDMLNYWILHILLMVLPAIYMWRGRFLLMENFHWDLFAWGAIVSFHVYLVQSMSFIFGMNINNYMMPPARKEVCFVCLNTNIFNFFFFVKNKNKKKNCFFFFFVCCLIVFVCLLCFVCFGFLFVCLIYYLFVCLL